MKKRIVFLIVVLLLVFGLVGPAAADGPPWPATVFHIEPGDCFTPWVDSDLNFITLFGQGIAVYQENNGNWNLKCSFFVDFDDPGVATIPETCAAFPQFCNGKGSFIVKDGIDCILDEGLVTTDTLIVVAPSGKYSLTCHFNGAAP